MKSEVVIHFGFMLMNDWMPRAKMGTFDACARRMLRAWTAILRVDAWIAGDIAQIGGLGRLTRNDNLAIVATMKTDRPTNCCIIGSIIIH